MFEAREYRGIKDRIEGFCCKIHLECVFWIWNLVLVSVVFMSCQSGKTEVSVDELDKSLLSMFASCSSIGGTNDVQVYKNEKLYGSFDLEWISKSNSWKMVLMSSIGQDILSIGYNKKTNKILLSDSSSFHHDLKVGVDGYIYVDSNFIPLKAQEISCFFNHHYPSSWIKSSTVYKKENSYFIEKKESKRSIRIELVSHKDESKRKLYSCSTISWDVFLWFDTSFRICVEDKKTSLIDIKDYLVKLTSIE